MNIAPRQDSPGRYYARINTHAHTRIGLDINFTGGEDFRISHLGTRVKLLKKKPRG